MPASVDRCLERYGLTDSTLTRKFEKIFFGDCVRWHRPSPHAAKWWRAVSLSGGVDATLTGLFVTHPGWIDS